MHKLWLLFIALQVTLQISFISAQVTFTRGWLAGKRAPSALSNYPVGSIHEGAQCLTFWPILQLLMEKELSRQEKCGPAMAKPGLLVSKMKEKLDKWERHQQLSQQVPEDDNEESAAPDWTPNPELQIFPKALFP